MTIQTTAHQAGILKFIGDYITAKGYAPSIKDIANHCGFASANAAFEHVSALEKKGLIKRDAGIPRSLRVVAQVGA